MQNLITPQEKIDWCLDNDQLLFDQDVNIRILKIGHA
jgi:hypothetical protein